jgi:hypothetical protein
MCAITVHFLGRARRLELPLLHRGTFDAVSLMIQKSEGVPLRYQRMTDLHGSPATLAGLVRDMAINVSLHSTPMSQHPDQDLKELIDMSKSVREYFKRRPDACRCALIGFEHVGMPYYITVRQFLADRGVDIDAADHDFELNIACSTSRGDEQMHGKPNDKDKDTGKDAQGKDTQGQGQINLFLASVQINPAELSDGKVTAGSPSSSREGLMGTQPGSCVERGVSRSPRRPS